MYLAKIPSIVIHHFPAAVRAVHKDRGPCVRAAEQLGKLCCNCASRGVQNVTTRTRREYWWGETWFLEDRVCCFLGQCFTGSVPWAMLYWSLPWAMLYWVCAQGAALLGLWLWQVSHSNPFRLVTFQFKVTGYGATLLGLLAREYPGYNLSPQLAQQKFSDYLESNYLSISF